MTLRSGFDRVGLKFMGEIMEDSYEYKLQGLLIFNAAIEKYLKLSSAYYIPAHSQKMYRKAINKLDKLGGEISSLTSDQYEGMLNSILYTISEPGMTSSRYLHEYILSQHADELKKTKIYKEAFNLASPTIYDTVKDFTQAMQELGLAKDQGFLNPDQGVMEQAPRAYTPSALVFAN